MDNKLEKIKNIYERRNSSNSKVIRPEFIKNEIENEDKLNNQINIGKRKTSVLEIVAIYEEKLRQLEKLRKNILLLNLTKKFGLSKYVDLTDPRDPKSEDKSNPSTPIKQCSDKENDSLSLHTDFTTFLIEIQKVMENIEIKSNFEKLKNEETLNEIKELKLKLQSLEKNEIKGDQNIIIYDKKSSDECLNEINYLKQDILVLKEDLIEKSNLISMFKL